MLRVLDSENVGHGILTVATACVMQGALYAPFINCGCYGGVVRTACRQCLSCPGRRNKITDGACIRRIKKICVYTHSIVLKAEGKLLYFVRQREQELTAIYAPCNSPTEMTQPNL